MVVNWYVKQVLSVVISIHCKYIIMEENEKLVLNVNIFYVLTFVDLQTQQQHRQ